MPSPELGQCLAEHMGSHGSVGDVLSVMVLLFADHMVIESWGLHPLMESSSEVLGL